ncbi:MAG: nickel-dependent hydrogenase large subunit [Acetobacteraceae bacterium]
MLLHAVGDAPAKALTAETLGRLDLPFEAIYSTFGRILARGLESKLLVDRMAGWHERLMANIAAGDVRTFNSARWAPDSWPRHSRGIGTIEGPRGLAGPLDRHRRRPNHQLSGRRADDMECRANG